MSLLFFSQHQFSRTTLAQSTMLRPIVVFLYLSAEVGMFIKTSRIYALLKALVATFKIRIINWCEMVSSVRVDALLAMKITGSSVFRIRDSATRASDFAQVFRGSR